MAWIKLWMVGLEDAAKLYPSELSGGMRKRAAIARAIALDPDILVFDEPSAGLDPIVAAGLDELILFLKETLGMTILVVTHAMESAFRIADRLAMLYQGHLIAVDAKERFRTNTHPRIRQFLDRKPDPVGVEKKALWPLTCESSNMSTEAKVGAFVLVSLLVLALTVYWVTHTQNVKGQVVFKTYFRYAGGLAPGAPVLFGGIKVGQVDEVGPSPEDPTRIEVTFNVKPGTPLNQNSKAHTGTVTLMGSPALLITTGTNDARRLNAGETVQSEEAVSLNEVANRVGALPTRRLR